MESFLATQRENVFSDVAVLIYVFDIESREVDRDLDTYSNIIKALKEYSPKAYVFGLIHKMDLVQNEHRERLYEERCRLVVARSEGLNLETFASSIWDQTLYKAWAGIVHKMIPNLAVIERFLKAFAKAVEAEEIVLFERSTFLRVTSVVPELGEENSQPDRHERISNIMKTFKHTVARNTQTTAASAGFILMKLQTPQFNGFLARFTDNTYVWIVTPPGEEAFNCAVLNTMMARESVKKQTTLEGANEGAGESGEPTMLLA